jgi:hypothetical protein
VDNAHIAGPENLKRAGEQDSHTVLSWGTANAG